VCVEVSPLFFLVLLLNFVVFLFLPPPPPPPPDLHDVYIDSFTPGLFKIIKTNKYLKNQ